VPAPFRSAVSSGDFPGIVVYRPTSLPCVEGADMAFLEQLSDRLYGDFGPFNTDQMHVATAILADASQLGFDPEGRVVLPQEFLDFAELDTHATFAGIGRKFQIWNPDKFALHREEAIKAAAVSAPKLPPFGGGSQS